MGLTAGQQRCVDTLDRPLVVAAGAGSGKTFTLTKRIVGALQNGFLSDIDEVCAITFTKKAAGELKSRLKGELRACGLVAQALKVDEAWVSTIHGMCARILRAHAVELGIDPAFSVAEGAQLQRYIDQSVDLVLTKAQEGESSAKLDALFAEYPARSFSGFGTSVEGMLIQLVGIASAQADSVDSLVLPGATLNPHLAVESALDVMEDVLALATDEKAGARRDGWMEQTERQVSDVRLALERGVSDPVEALALMAPFKLVKTFGGKAFKARVDEARGELGACLMEVRLGAANAHLETLIELTRRALDAFAGLKRADGVLDNSDLLVMAARALEEHPSIAARYSDKFKLVMVDEFQDTDQMQVDMIKRLAGEGACRLCTVGDAQQSIYRFRGADVSVYRRHLASVRAQQEGVVIELSENFRSHPDVLSFVDRVFGQSDMFGNEFMSLSAGRDEGRVKDPFDLTRNRVVVQHTARPSRGVSADEACEVAARRIASEFAGLAEAGRSPSEMVVLRGRMTNAGVYARAMRDAGLPCIIAGGSVFAQTLEAGMVRELVRTIANPNETQSLFNVLTSPLFSLSAGDLLEVGGLGGFWKAARETNDVAGRSPQLSCALRVMGAMRDAVGNEAVSRVVERVAVDSGWLSRLEQRGAEGLASAGNLYKAIRMIRDIEQGGACGPASVMRAFEDALENSKEAPGALSVSGGNSVRIMTIHASKGLEFPIVAVAEVKESSASSSKLLSASVSGKVYLSLDLSRTAEGLGGSVDLEAIGGYVLGETAGEEELAAAVAEDAGALHRRLAVRSYLAAGDEEEAKRLLYVAITRAREVVVISSLGKRTKDNPFGVPKNALAGIFAALDPQGAEVGEGVSCIDFGGSLPAVVECRGLEAEDESEKTEDAERDTLLHDTPEQVETSTDARPLRDTFFVPAVERREPVARDTFRALREGVFSYSSIADSSHEGDVLVRLAHAYAISVDGACEDSMDDLTSSSESSLAADGVQAADEESRPFDEDRATDLGTAFHRLAQYSVVARNGIQALARPPRERIDALSRTCNLDAAQRGRLERALNRWFTCDLAREMAEFSHLEAEVPFFIVVPAASGEPSFLEGEIDLLGYDDERHAHVVDYKTGGRSDETPDELREKHVLQASCYAYAVLLQGARSVVADFVRVERGRGDDATQPQCVRYRFDSDDLPELERAIACVYARTIG